MRWWAMSNAAVREGHDSHGDRTRVVSCDLVFAIAEPGEVAKVQPVSGNALLSSAAVNAVKKWKFKPFTAEGKPAKAVVRLSFNFNL